MNTKLSPEEMYELLTSENKEKVNRQIEILIAVQSNRQSELYSRP